MEFTLALEFTFSSQPSNVGASNVILLLVYCILIFVAVYTLISFIEGIMYGIYDDLIYDLRQLKIFYVKEK